MRQPHLLLLSGILLMAAVPAPAAEPVANLTAAAAVTLNGIELPLAAVPSWPIVAGDEIVTSSSVALLRFFDDTHVDILPRSRVTVEKVAGELRLRLGEGAIDYRRGPDARVIIDSEGALVPDEARQGRVGALDSGEPYHPRARRSRRARPPADLGPRSESSNCGGTLQVLPPRARCR